MPATTKVPLGAATLNNKWYLDVNTGTHAIPTWTGVFGITEFQPVKDPTLKDDSDFDSKGWGSETVTKLAWSVSMKVVRKVKASDATSYDDGQEELRASSDMTGANNRVEVRFYEMTDGGPRVEAHQGYAAVSWNPDGGPMDALDIVSVTLTGQGELEPITHPEQSS
jgi:hypothetical protein